MFCNHKRVELCDVNHGGMVIDLMFRDYRPNCTDPLIRIIDFFNGGLVISWIK